MPCSPLQAELKANPVAPAGLVCFVRVMLQVGGTGVFVGVLVAVFVAVLVAVAVGVLVAVGVGVGVLVAVAVGVRVGVLVGGTTRLGGDDSPKLLSPQQAILPSVFTAQLWFSPALT